jgi:hypothetical protein
MYFIKIIQQRFLDVSLIYDIALPVIGAIVMFAVCFLTWGALRDDINETYHHLFKSLQRDSL